MCGQMGLQVNRTTRDCLKFVDTARVSKVVAGPGGEQDNAGESIEGPLACGLPLSMAGQLWTDPVSVVVSNDKAETDPKQEAMSPKL